MGIKKNGKIIRARVEGVRVRERARAPTAAGSWTETTFHLLARTTSDAAAKKTPANAPA